MVVSPASFLSKALTTKVSTNYKCTSLRVPCRLNLVFITNFWTICTTNYRADQEIMQLWSSSNSKWVSLLFIGFAISLFFQRYQLPSPLDMAEDAPKSVYDFTVKDIRGNDVSLAEYSGKVLLIVNVASKCGLTESNYKELNVLYEKYKDQGFEILAFPCNQFLGQEPGDNEEIQQTVCTRFKAEFPIFDKVEVNGNNVAPLYKFLKSQQGGFLGDRIKWNFTKFLVNKEGKVIQRYGPYTAPLKIEKDIQDQLAS